MRPFPQICRLAPYVLVLVLAINVVGCASTSSTSTSPASDAAPTLSVSEAEDRLHAAAERWEGTPHEWGGTTRRGVDCSGLVQSIYADAFGYQVPRTTDQQVEWGRFVERDDLKPGDLVFFRPGSGQRHVGIYVSDGQFLHASSSDGVRLSPLDRSYWVERWWQGRRLLSFNASAPSTSDPSSSDATGW